MTSTNFTGSLTGDVTGTQSNSVVSLVGGQTASNVALSTISVLAATSLSTPSTIVQRDSSNNFDANTITANLTGSASNNVLKAGDSMTGPLQMLGQTTVNFNDLIGNYVGINAPSSVPSSYTLSLPSTIPTSHQSIRTNGLYPTNLEWITEAGSILPASSRIISVTKYGSDATGDGSYTSPYTSLAKAIELANSISTSSIPITIQISPGTYVENNSGSPLTITANGITIEGSSPISVIIIPSTPTNNLLLINNPVQIINITFESIEASATGISISATNLSVFTNVYIYNFLVGIECGGDQTSSYGFNNCLFVSNVTGLNISNVHSECNNCTVFGTQSLIGPASNTGIVATGSGSNVVITGGVCGVCTNGIHITNNATISINAVSFRINVEDIIQDGASQMTLSASSFELGSSPIGLTGPINPNINIQISGAGTMANIIGCDFDGEDENGTPLGTAIIVTTNAMANIKSNNIINYITGIQVGLSGDTSSTALFASSITIDNCTTNILQQGSSSLTFTAGTASSQLMDINDGTNVILAFFDLDSNTSLTIGSTTNKNITLLQASIGSDPNPQINYTPSLYSTQAIGLNNPSPTTWFVQSNNQSNLTAITTDRTNIAQLRLVSDTRSTVGGTTALRGWDINKNSTSADLSFNYLNSDTIGQPAIIEYALLQLDGVNNQLQFPTTGTKIVFDSDTNLYRLSNGVLKTDNNFTVGALTAGTVVTTSASTNQLLSSVTTGTELGYLSGTTSTVQTQLNSKVNKAGDTMGGTLQLIAGTPSSPALVFTGSQSTGISASNGSLSISANGVECMKISSSGTVSIDQFTVTGVVHNDSFGNLSSALISNTDISNGAGITDSKLSTIATAGKVANSATTATNLNTPNSIVERDGSGNFIAGTITSNLTGTVTGSSSLNVLKSGDTMTGPLILPAGSASAPSVLFGGSTLTGISAGTSNTLSFDTNGTEQMKIDGSGNMTISNLNLGIVHTSSTGELSSSLIVNADITMGTIQNSSLKSISSSNVSGDIVVRDSSGNFSTNMIMIIGTTTNSTDVATKSYVDSVASTGLIAKTPAIVVSPTNIGSPPTGLLTIDSIILAEGDRILLVGQTGPVENGLWVAQTDEWTRPTDFNTGSTADEAYVLILSGANYAGSSWLCNTPDATVGSDPIVFVEFSLPNQIIGNNVGMGSGLVYQGKTGISLNFRTIEAGSHITVSNNSDNIALGTDSTSVNTPSTIVSRDSSGNFSAGTITANLTGSSSNNVLKAGDSMSGPLSMLTQTAINFNDGSNSNNFVGINAPNIVSSSYMISLPALTPTSNQSLRAGNSTPTNLEWTTSSGIIAPSASLVIYVAIYGSDTTGNGSSDAPLASLSKAISIANGIATISTPITIFISSGTFVENNSIGPLAIIAPTISIVGNSSASTILIPNTPTNDFITSNQTCYIGELTIFSEAALANGIVLTQGALSTLNSIVVSGFLTGINLSGTTSSYICNNCIFVNNTTGLNINDTVGECNDCEFLGSESIYGIPSNTAFNISGAVAVGVISGGAITLCVTGLIIGNNSLVNVSAVVFKLNTYDVVQTDASHMTLSACTFAIATGTSDIDIQMSGAGTYAEIIGCEFNGKDITSVLGTIALYIYGGASLDLNGGGMKYYTTALQVGAPTDTSSTSLLVSALNIHDCTTDILQQGSSTLNFNSSTSSSSKITINDSTNVTLAFFDIEDNNALHIGSRSNSIINLIKACIAPSNQPRIEYNPSIYGAQTIGYVNPTNNPTSWYVESNQNATLLGITTDRTQISGLGLFSDTGTPLGTTGALRGWALNKLGSTSQLAFNYQNSDPISQAIISPYTVFQLDGVNNLVQLPNPQTKIVFDSDTNLYRGTTGVLQTDNNFIVGTLTPNTVVTTNPLTNQLTSSITSGVELSYLSGSTSNIQSQLNLKVNRAGDVMTGPLQLPGGSIQSPSLSFTSTLVGISSPNNNLAFSTGGTEQMVISSGGSIQVPSFGSAGIIHNDSVGNLSSSLITNSDIATNANISDSKLNTISTANKVANSATTATSASTPSTIVERDSSSNFSAGTITANLNGNASTATTASSATTAVNFTGSLVGDVTGTQSNSVVSSVGGQTASNIATSTLIVNASTNIDTPSTLVKRDISGNFSAGTITANLTGSSSNNVLKAGDTMNGTLTMETSNAINFGDSNGNYVGLNAPSIVPSSYTLSLPSTIPTANQSLRAGSTPTNLEWTITSNAIVPSVSFVIYVTIYGSDSNGNGSADMPFASLSKAISIANSIATVSTPVTIFISSGTFVENNSTSPLAITSSTISIIGCGPSSVTLIPNTPYNDFITSNQTCYISNLTLLSEAPMANGLVLTNGSLSELSGVRIIGFLNGINLSGTSSSYICSSCIFVNNGTGSIINDTVVEFIGCEFVGSTSIYGIPSNTAISISGAVSIGVITGGSVTLCVTGLNIGNNSLVNVSAVVFKLNTYDVIQTDASHMTLSACTFAIATGSLDIDIQMSGAGTYGEIIGCEFNGRDINSVPGSLALYISNGASLDLNGGGMKYYTTALKVGSSTDTSSTTLLVSALNIHDCTTDILQQGSSTLNLNSSTSSSSKILINDPTNVTLAFFDVADNNALHIGSTANAKTSLLQAFISSSNCPDISYNPSIYQTQAIGFVNPTLNPTSWYVSSNSNTNLLAITTDRTQVSSLQLISDTGTPLGTTGALRGWSLNKNSLAQLAFNYQNSDIIGQPIITPYTVLQLDGVNNLVQLPNPQTKLMFGSDTNLYRGSTGVLQTDNNFIVGTLTPNTVVMTNLTNQLSSSITTSTELSYLSGTTSNVQSQLNLKVNKGGDTMTGPLQLSAGSNSAPSLTFTGGTNCGLSSNSGNLSLITNGSEQIRISSGGVVAIDSLTVAGVVHTDASGNLSGSLISNSDISSNANITDSKLATITSASKVANSATTATSLNTMGSIVARDSSGNFSAGTITANLTGTSTNFSGSLAGDVIGTQSATTVSSVGGQTASNVASATILANLSTNLDTINTIVKRDGSGNFSAGTITANLTGTSTNFSGSLIGDVTGTQSNSVVSLIGGQTASNVAAATTLANLSTNLDTINTIVKRDGSGNFSAGTITASLTGSASLNVLTSGGTMTGTLIHPAGTASAPSIQFTGSTNTGISASTTNTLSFDTNGVERMNISSSGVTIDAMTTSGIVHNSALGLLTSSLIVGADITSGTISNTSLATISSSNVAGDIVVRDGSGNFSAGTITANLTGTSTNFSGSLAGDVTGIQSATIVSLVGGQSASSVATATILANASTDSDTGGTLVKRGLTGNFSSGTITATLNGTSTNFSGSLTGDVTGTQSNSVVSLVGGQTASSVSTATILANGATNLSTPNTIIKRDNSGNVLVNNVTEGYATTITSGSSSILVVGSAPLQFFTGTTTQTVILPVTNTLVLGLQFVITNNSTGIITVQSSGLNTIGTVSSLTSTTFTCISITGTGTSSWNAVSNIGPAGATGLQGLVGATGLQGIQGLIGPTGLQGLVGATGLQGLIGPTGIQGLVGASGLQGLVGATGLQGLVGATGLQGLIGPTGLQGLIGATGLQGLIGATGLQGLIGATGLQGLVGATGIKGPTGPAGSVTIGGSTTQVQYNNAGTLAGTANLTIDTDYFPILGDQTSPPPTVPASGAKIYSELKAGRHLCAQIGPSGLQHALQPSLFTNGVSWYIAQGNSTTVSTMGFGNTITGTATARTVATTSLLTSIRRIGFVTSAATAGSSTGTTHGFEQFWMGNASGLGGFYYVVRFGMSSATTVSTQRNFVGLAATTAVLPNADPSTNQNILGFSVDSKDSSWYFITNGTSGMCATFIGVIALTVLTVVSISFGTLYLGQLITGTGVAANTYITAFITGIGGIGTYTVSVSQVVLSVGMTAGAVKNALVGTFPPRDLSVSMFEARIYCPPNSSTISYSLEVLNGGSFYSGSTNINLPANTTLLSPQIWTNNGTTAGKVGIDVISQYIETDF